MAQFLDKESAKKNDSSIRHGGPRLSKPCANRSVTFGYRAARKEKRSLWAI